MTNAFRWLLQELNSIPTSDVPLIGWHHRLCLLAVIMEIKPAFAIGFDEPIPKRLLQFLDQQSPLLKIFLRETRRPPRRYLEKARVPPLVADAIAERWNQSENASRNVLWVYKSEEIEEQIEEAVAGSLSPGAVLGYPGCCEEAYEADQVSAVEMYERKLRTELGAETEEDVVALIRGPAQVESAPPGASRAIHTLSRFPFLPFIACEACLAEEESEAAALNDQFQQMMAEVDILGARKIMLMAQAMVQSAQGRSTKANIRTPEN